MGSSGGAGKDTVAKMIDETIFQDCGRTYTELALGQKIHEICRAFNTAPGDRDKLQALGEAVRQIFGMNAWIDHLDNQIKYYNESDSGVIVTDIRKLLEYAHYAVEKEFLPLYVKVDAKVARQRLKQRDGFFNEEDLKRDIETQMLFVQNLPTTIVDGKLRKVANSGIFNDIYIIDNNGTLAETQSQIESWWKCVQ